jgi:indole-3-glycerol phosphate synthase
LSIIDEILTASARKLEERRVRIPQVELEKAARDADRASTGFADALAVPDFSIIAEWKRRSPSAGAMNEPNLAEALGVYTRAEVVSAISVLTNEDHFGNTLDDLRRVRRMTRKPILRKDFIVDPYQVWEARAAGADAILLMAALHVDAPARMHDLFALATSLGMDALFEIGMGDAPLPEQCRSIPTGARVIGINSRQFKSIPPSPGAWVGKDPSTQKERHRELRKHIPSDRLAVAESGIHEAADLRALVELGYNAALIGTALLKGPATVDAVMTAFGREIARATPRPKNARTIDRG